MIVFVRCEVCRRNCMLREITRKTGNQVEGFGCIVSESEIDNYIDNYTKGDANGK